MKKGYNRFKDPAFCHGKLLPMTPSFAENERFLSCIDRIYASKKDSVMAAGSISSLIKYDICAGSRSPPRFDALTVDRNVQKGAPGMCS